MKLLKLTVLLLALLNSSPAYAATYSFFTPAQTTNVVNGLITSGTFGSGAFNINQFAVTPFSSIVIKSGALVTNTVLYTPVGTTVAWTGGTNSAMALLSCTTPGLTGYLYGNNTGAITASIPLDPRIKWTNSIVDLPSIPAQSYFDITRPCTDASTNSTVSVSVDGGGNTNVILYAWADATNSVTIRAMNTWTAAADPASATWRITVINHNQ